MKMTVTAIEAVGMLNGVKLFDFIVSLVVFKKIFSVSANLSNVLQSKTIDLSAASFSFSQLLTHSMV